MANINKYWIILETLKFPMAGVQSSNDGFLCEEQRVKANLNILKDYIKLSPEDVFKNIIKDDSLQHSEYKQLNIVEDADDHFLYCLYSLEMLLEINNNVNFSSDAKEDLVSERHKSLIISSIVDVASIALQEHLHPSFYKGKGSIFKKKCEMQTNFFRLEFIVTTFSPLMHIRGLHVGKSLDDVQLWYMASIFSLLVAFDLKDYNMEQDHITNLQYKLQTLWLELSKKLYYRNLMLLFSIMPNTQKQRAHKEMLVRLWSPGGFVALLFAMSESQRSEEQSLDELVANLVAQSTFSIKAQLSLIKQVLQFLRASLRNQNFSEHMGAGLLSLKKLYDNKTENKEYIKNWLEKEMQPLVEVELPKIIAMDWVKFVDLISLLFHIFCTSSISALPSKLLVAYLPLFLDLHSQLECHTRQNTLRNHIQSLILQILNNRSREELKQIIEYETIKPFSKDWFQLSSNIQVKENALNMFELKLSIVDNDAIPLLVGNKHTLASLVGILKSCSYYLLVYEHFLILLKLVPSLIIDTNSVPTNNTNIDLLESEEDICNKVLMDFSQMYENKIQIIKALESLVRHQPLRSLINNNIKDILNVLQDILSVYTETFSKDNSQTEMNSTVLVILLILIREIIENCTVNVEDLQINLLKPLKRLNAQIQCNNVNYQINCILKIMQGNESFSSQNCEPSKMDFEEARNLIESNKSYLQVDGIEKMIKLLNKRDAFSVANSHVLTALALNTLKSTESYTFLNCVRLFVALVNVNESEVLDLLSDEYLNEAADLDYRLIIGEAILKTSKELGPLCYKYKNVLLNAFMAGCRSSLNEFRFSAFSNLSHMCCQLTYQVHNYFQELLNLIDCELTNGKYLPAKRAAVMVLSDLLAGMDDLFDYEEMLLPIYRLLKNLAISENTDEKISIHASNGLKCLSQKCKKLFRASLEQHEQGKPLEKEIKIMGINNRPGKNIKSHIIEIN